MNSWKMGYESPRHAMTRKCTWNILQILQHSKPLRTFPLCHPVPVYHWDLMKTSGPSQCSGNPKGPKGPTQHSNGLPVAAAAAKTQLSDFPSNTLEDSNGVTTCNNMWLQHMWLIHTYTLYMWELVKKSSMDLCLMLLFSCWDWEGISCCSKGSLHCRELLPRSYNPKPLSLSVILRLAFTLAGKKGATWSSSNTWYPMIPIDGGNDVCFSTSLSVWFQHLMLQYLSKDCRCTQVVRWERISAIIVVWFVECWKNAVRWCKMQ